MNTKQLVAFNFRRLRLANGWTQEQCAAKGGVSAGYIGKIESRNIKSSWGPDSEAKWSVIFNVQPFEFYKSPELVIEEKRTGSVEKRLDLVNLAVFNAVPCGAMGTVEEVIIDWMPTSRDLLGNIPHPEINAFWVVARGNSMEPLIKDGTRVLVVNGYADGVVINNRDLVIVLIEDQVTLKRIYDNGDVFMLMPENHKEHDPILIPKAELRGTYTCIYKVLGRYEPLI